MVVFKFARDIRFAGDAHIALSRDPAGRNLPGRGWRRLRALDLHESGDADAVAHVERAGFYVWPADAGTFTRPGLAVA